MGLNKVYRDVNCFRLSTGEWTRRECVRTLALVVHEKLSVITINCKLNCTRIIRRERECRRTAISLISSSCTIFYFTQTLITSSYCVLLLPPHVKLPWDNILSGVTNLNKQSAMSNCMVQRRQVLLLLTYHDGGGDGTEA